MVCVLDAEVIPVGKFWRKTMIWGKSMAWIGLLNSSKTAAQMYTWNVANPCFRIVTQRSNIHINVTLRAQYCQSPLFGLRLGSQCTAYMEA